MSLEEKIRNCFEGGGYSLGAVECQDGEFRLAWTLEELKQTEENLLALIRQEKAKAWRKGYDTKGDDDFCHTDTPNPYLEEDRDE